MPLSIRFSILASLFLLASCGDDGWSIEAAEVVETHRGTMVEVRLPKERQDRIRKAGDVLYLEFLRCGEMTALATSPPLNPEKNAHESLREIQVYLVPKEVLNAKIQPICARLKRTGFGFNGSRSEDFLLSFQSGDSQPE